MSDHYQEGKNKFALVTGASAGIGKALATEFARHGFGLILVARRKDRLTEIANTLNLRYNVPCHVYPADLSKNNAAQKLYDQLQKDGLQVDALVNNAGYAIMEKFTDASWKDHQAFLNVMLLSLTQLCYLFGQDMKRRGYGRILNVSSVAAYSPEWSGSLYGGIKSYVAHFSEALDLELKPHNVYCTALMPGFTYSEFHDVMGAKGALAKLPTWLWMDAETVAKEGYNALMNGEPAHINGLVNRSMVTAFNLMPRKLKYLISSKQSIL